MKNEQEIKTMEHNFIDYNTIDDNHPIALQLFGICKIFTNMQEACIEASWCLNREIVPHDILNAVNNKGYFE
jgi:hypothetical protein